MIIYKAIFPNNKVYIGKTNNLENRKESHYYDIWIQKCQELLKSIK